MNSGLRILHVSQPTTAGVARIVIDLVRHQIAEGIDVVVACPAPPPSPGAGPPFRPDPSRGPRAVPAGALAAEALAAGARVLRWPAGREPGPGLAGETVRLGGAVRAARPDLVHLHSAKAGLAGRLAVRGRLPTVFAPHAWSFAAVDGPVARAALAWERFGASWADRVLCVSGAERDEGAAAGVRARWAVVRNGVDPAPYARAAHPAARAAARARLGLDPDAPLVLCVGRMCRQKGQDVLLDAWRRLRSAAGAAAETGTGRAPAAPAPVLALVGDGPDAAALAGAAAALPGVLLPGPAPDPRPWYAAADLVVVPSRWDGMALVILEAAASGRAVLASDVAGAREALPADQRADGTVPPGDPAALAAALARLLADRAALDAWGAAARTYTTREHTTARMGRRTTALYRSVLAERRGTGVKSANSGR